MRLNRLLASVLLIFLLAEPGYAKFVPIRFDVSRNRLIEFMLSSQLPAEHFSRKSLDDVAPAAFDLYLRQLDARKRFLLQADVRELRALAVHLADNLRRGRVVLPDRGAALYNRQVRQVQGMVDQLMKTGFDPGRQDYLETDPKKIDYAATEAELRDRWRRILKMQVMETYLDLREQEKKKSSVEQNKKEKESAGVRQDKERSAGDVVDQALWIQAMDKVHERTQHYLHRLLLETRQDHYNRYFEAIARAFGPHTDYMAPASREDFDIRMSGFLDGIGALLREDDGHIKVMRIIPGSAAARQGELRAEDTILAVAEKGGTPVDISDMRVREAVSYIRGPKGTEVSLTVRQPDGTKKIIRIIRDVVHIEATYVKSVFFVDKQGNKLGYILIPGFYRDFAPGKSDDKPRNVTDDMRRALHKMKEAKVRGLILDLRNNGGGSLADAVDVSGLFLPGGPVVQVKNSRGVIRVLKDEDKGVSFSGPMIVLVNKFSASASEIFAAAMQDYGRALIIGGNHTYGKGTVQALMDLNRNLPILHLKKYDDLGALKVTIQKFYRINGESTQDKGVHPDVVVPTVLDFLKSGEKYMDYSLPWDQVKAVPYKRWPGFHFNVAAARRLGEKWVAASPAFKKIKEESDQAKVRAEKTRLPDYLAAVEKERREWIAERKEDGGRGTFFGKFGAERSGKKPGKKNLQEQLAKDPLVQMSVYLMDDLAFSRQAIVRTL